ncbi:DUF1553 domain-containing protein [Lentisphaera profundi]|uniref:DUF1553 domain-containing protein n=1 Tax=Lentisphaera profundi TaxID=1658616 RepID=A0ABY7VS75_9BACT|nr:DUF1553 domain-containing protein [Lentisphaera profundi]WDE95742.1 DUF1553 domain-containing protein [Lentisphaera profundi]
MIKFAPVKKELEIVDKEIKDLSDSKSIQARYKQWKIDSKKNAETKITTVKSTHGANFKKLSDGSFLRKKNRSDKDNYIISLNQSTPADKLMLAFLVDPTYRNKLGIGNGNVVLSVIEINEINKGGEKIPVKITAAAADFSQGGFPVKNLITASKKANRGWAISGQTKLGENRHAVLKLERMIKGQIEVTLKFQSIHSAHMAGRFDLELSSKDIKPQDYAIARLKNLEAFTRLLAEFSPLHKHLDKLEAQAESLDYGRADCQITEAVKPMITRVLARGNWQDESGEIVEPAIPAFLGKIEKEGRANRLDLANWLVSEQNPLTARVFVNRLWYLYFGRGLSQVVEDLGSQGETPDNPELLDYLAWSFRKDNWNVKNAVKRILMSKAYRQSTERDATLVNSDPFNIKLARQNARRLEAEFIRDNILQMSGLLNKTVGGKSIKPYQPAGYYAQLNFPRRTYQVDKDQNQYRKGLYIHRQRTFLHPMLKAFDTPSADTCNARRSASNTPLQSLALLNDPSFLEAAGAFAKQAIASPESNVIEWMLQHALTRPIGRDELQELTAFYQDQQAYFMSSPQDADKFLLSLKIKDADKYNKIDLAAYGSVARLIFNLHETLSVY